MRACILSVIDHTYIKSIVQTSRESCPAEEITCRVSKLDPKDSSHWSPPSRSRINELNWHRSHIEIDTYFLRLGIVQNAPCVRNGLSCAAFVRSNFPILLDP
jgi:hypothetical protein